MRYLIWGTGNAAKHLLTRHINEFFFRNPIVAFVDNDIQKRGMRFWGKEIIAPWEIRNYLYDVIFICCDAEESIRQQIREQLNLQVTILTRKDISEEMYKFYHDEMKVYDKKVLAVGNPDNKMANLSRAYIFREVQYLGIDEIDDAELVCLDYEYDYVLCTWPSEYWYLSPNGRYEEAEYKLIEKIVNAGWAERNSVLTFSVVEIYQSVDKLCSFGEENPDRTFLLIRPGVGTVGLGGVILQVLPNIAYARKNNMIPVVDMQSFKNSYNTPDEIGKLNSWEKFFQQPDQWHVEDIQKSKNIVESMRKRTYMDIKEAHLGKYLTVKPVLAKETEEYCKDYFNNTDKILGVLVRGSDYVTLKPYAHCIQPDIVLMLETVWKKFESEKYDLIYLCTEEEEIVKRFKEEFGEKVFYYPTQRIEKPVKGYLSDSSMYINRDLYRVGADYWIELYALSQCNALVAGDCSGTHVALILNESKYEDVYIFELGRYGIDDTENDKEYEKTKYDRAIF